MSSFWDEVERIELTREANVETWLVLPLLNALGYEHSLIESKVPVIFQEGRSTRPGRKPEADFVVYAERPFSRATSLIVVETKRSDEQLEEGRAQGESYAQNLRTPILLMTNGVRFEIWQLQASTESVRVLECDVAELRSKRGAIEGLLSREALKAHCARIEYKRFDVAAGDLGAYELAEYERVFPVVRRAILRTSKAFGTGSTVRSNELLDTQTRGAVILGASGLGKSTLADMLLHDGVERRWLGESTALPIEVFLPDLASSSTNLKEFARDRIAAHKPGFTSAMLDVVIRDQGLTIIADGFERVPHERRSEIESGLRMFLRDCPHCQLFIMSRAALSTVNLPNMSLVEYTANDLHELGRLRSYENEAAAWAFRSAPEYIYRIGEIPLLAELMLERYSRERRHTTNLASLYEAWIEQLLSSLTLVDQALSRSTLEQIASETSEGPISIGRVLDLCRVRSDPEASLERLIAISAISVRGTSVELRHEALADYLRAALYWRSSHQSAGLTLNDLSFDPSSQFGLLLVATAPTRAARRAAWQAVARADIQLAIHSLHYAAGSELLSGQNCNVEAIEFLGDVRDSIENLVSSHLHPVGHLLREEIAGTFVHRLGISGNASAEDVSYFFFEANGAPDSIRLALPSGGELPPKFYNHALRRVGYGPEAGRILGATRVKESLIKQIKLRTLSGGLIWTQERVFGRLRHLAREYHAPVNSLELQNALNILEDDRDYLVAGEFNGNQTFLISDLIADIEILTSQGISGIPAWAEGIDDLDLHIADDQSRFCRVMNEYYRRVQVVYNEVAYRSFPRLGRYLQTLAAMPLRYEFEVEFYVRNDTENVALHYRRFPTADYLTAGADVSFPDTLSDHDSAEAVQTYLERTDALLAQFGRPSGYTSAQWGWCGIPDFEGRDTTFDGLRDESVVVRTAMQWMKKDIEHIFSEIPSYRFDY
ncbi:type I restriction enzyme HsdR N-terminal domain-containing protein [Methylobacterium brachiatum]|uniref:type I restriction enzyme HsdR N-terminal domain-containing protein n=1 Tax=Methylobacterium brachiatum TaxID=269660 RepID=UPI00244D2F23|nr:type I restriction enzyme HsdR N-terminal domain-containing protein [Methylobacterium brachiatum]MDH2310334.1 type I restriction enzyme HsdR N-terminal domain-containing protein [Methylobacterium brachiatum]